MIHRLL